MSKYTKTCNQCNVTYEAEDKVEMRKYFYRQNAKDDRLRSKCKTCMSKGPRTYTTPKKVLEFKDGKFINQCSECKTIYETKTEEEMLKYFYANGKATGSLRSKCKECMKPGKKYVANPKGIEHVDGKCIKKCTKCGEVYETETEEDMLQYFYKSGKTDLGLRASCKVCARKQTAQS